MSVLDDLAARNRRTRLTFQLRRQTDCTLDEAAEALRETRGDIGQAVEWLRRKAVMKGGSNG
jgi:translation elongation factor EF-Ts